MSIKRFLQDIVNKQYEYYIKSIHEEIDRVIEDKDYDLLYVNKEDFDYVGTDIIFPDIIKKEEKIYGIYPIEYKEEYEENCKTRKLCVVEVDPMIAFDERFKELEENCSLDSLVKDYTIKKTNFYIKMDSITDNINGVEYICNFKPVLCKEINFN